MISNKLRSAAKIAAEDLAGYDLANAEFIADTPIDFGSLNNYISGLDVIKGLHITGDGLQIYFVGGPSQSQTDKVLHAKLTTAFDVTTAYIVSISTFTETVRFDSIALSSDGSKLYLTQQGDGIHEYDLSNNFNPQSATHVIYTATGDNPTIGQFDSTGTKLYFARRLGGGTSEVAQYSLSIPWDTSTLSFVQSFSTTSELDGYGGEVLFNQSGTKMFCFAYSDGYGFPVYSLSTAWDISTAVLSEHEFPALFNNRNVDACFFNGDFTEFYFQEYGILNIYKIGLATAETFTGLSHKSFDLDDQQTAPYCGYMSVDGTKMFDYGTTGYEVTQYSLSVPFDCTTATFVNSVNLGSSHNSVWFSPDGLHFYSSSSSYPGGVFYYSLSTPFDLNTRTLVYKLEDYYGIRYCYYAMLDPSGLRLYVHSDTYQSIFQYDLTTAWDISTATLVGSFNFAISQTRGFYISDDGSKFTLVDTNADTLRSYELTTAWDISTSQAVASTLIFGTPWGVFYGNSGAEMYWINNQNDFLYQATQSTPFGIFYPLANDVGAISATITSATSFAFNSDGTQLNVTDQSSLKISKFNLQTPYDFSSLEFAGQVLMPYTPESANGYDKLQFKTDGAKAYLYSFEGKTIYQYSLSQPFDLTSGSYETLQDFGLYGDLVHISNDGSRLYNSRSSRDEYRQYDLSTPWDISTASLASNTFIYSIGWAHDILFTPDGLVAYVIDRVSSTQTVNWIIFQFPLSSAFNLSSIISSQQKSLYLVDLGINTAHNVQFSADGLNLHIVDSIQDSITTLPLDTAFDIHGFYHPITSVGTSAGVSITPDGTRLSRTYNNRIYEREILTAGDIRTVANADQTNIAVSYGEVNGVNFITYSSNGSKLYAGSYSSGELAEYNTATPFSAVGMTFVQKILTTAVHYNNKDLKFSPSGHKMYILALTSRGIHEWDLSTPWDISTAIYNQMYETASAEYLEIKPNGKSIYYGQRLSAVFQLDLTTAWDLSTATFYTSFTHNNSVFGRSMYFNEDGSNFVLTDGNGNLTQFEIIEPEV